MFLNNEHLKSITEETPRTPRLRMHYDFRDSVDEDS